MAEHEARQRNENHPNRQEGVVHGPMDQGNPLGCPVTAVREGERGEGDENECERCFHREAFFFLTNSNAEPSNRKQK